MASVGSEMRPPRTFPWKEFWILFGAGLFGVLAVIPFAAHIIRLRAAQIPLPFPIVLLLQVVQGAALVAITAGVGLIAARKVGLGAPLLERWLVGSDVRSHLRHHLLPALWLGLPCVIGIVLLDFFFFLPRLPELARSVRPLVDAPLWEKLLAAFYGGITEELLLRLFLMSLLAWGLAALWRSPDGAPPAEVFWTANIAAAVLFGLGHLPATAAFVPLTPLIIARAIVLNGVLGVAFGYLYWRRGLEAAMLAHMAGDIVIQVAGHFIQT